MGERGGRKKEEDSDNYELRLYIDNPETLKNQCYFLTFLVFRGFP
jgi:hypothetical protein